MTASSTDDHVVTLVLNALIATVGEDASFLADTATRVELADAFRTVTTSEQRDAFRTAITAAHSPDGPPDAQEVSLLQEVTHAVIAELAARNSEALVTHRVQLTVPSREAHLYTYFATNDASVLGRLDLSPDVSSPVERGGRHVDSDDLERAVECFEQAVTESASGSGAVATRVLAAVANHWREADDRALDFVEEALHLDTGAWCARLVGLAAGHEYAELFRDGHLGARVFLRFRIDIPDGSAVVPEVGFGEMPPETWTVLAGDGGCYPIDVLEPSTWIQLELSGTLPTFPAVHGYYVAFGVVDLDDQVALDIEEILLSGPQTVDSVETLKLESGMPE